jgi:hypothetical protein
MNAQPFGNSASKVYGKDCGRDLIAVPSVVSDLFVLISL